MNTTLHPSVNHKPGDWRFLLANPPTLSGPEPSRAKRSLALSLIERNQIRADAAKEAVLLVLSDGRNHPTALLAEIVGEGRNYVLKRMYELEDDRKVLKVRGTGATWLWRLK